MAETGKLVISSYGVTVEIDVEEPQRVPAVKTLLPPGWSSGDPDQVVARFALRRGGVVTADGQAISDGADATAALGLLDAAVRGAIALHAPEHVFVHAGVVAVDGRAIVLPGSTWSGKTTLVAELVLAGATYFSDEFAVFDRNGFVLPYAKPLSVRRPGSYDQVELPASDLGEVAETSARVAVIAALRYVGADGVLHTGSAGDGALALMSHAVAARSRPERVLAAVCAAADDALYVEGVRGEAEHAAAALLDLIDRHAATPPHPPAHAARAARAE